MRLHGFLVTAFLATAMACGGDNGSPSATQSGFLTAPDSGTDSSQDGGTAAEDAGPSSTGSCDCSGMALPDICMVCTDGQSACAHFVCNAGMCEVAICQ
jgi:hypothetical protein